MRAVNVGKVWRGRPRPRAMGTILSAEGNLVFRNYHLHRHIAPKEKAEAPIWLLSPFRVRREQSRFTQMVVDAQPVARTYSFTDCPADSQVTNGVAPEGLEPPTSPCDGSALST
jgi:hypothetical protein